MPGQSGRDHYGGHVANGRAVGRFEAVLGLIGIIALVVTYSLITGWNPLPAAGNWLDKVRSFSEPAATWKVTVGDQPSNAVVGSNAVIIGARGNVEARRLSNGEKIWSRDVDWAAVAGGDGAVVIAGRTGKGHGYDAVDPDTGRNLWKDDDAIGVWTFTDLVVGIACPEVMTCTLTARTPLTGTVKWTSQLTGNGRTLAGANKALSGVHPLSDVVAPPRPVPAMLGFPLDDQVEVVSSATGKRLHSYKGTQTARVVLAGDHVLVTTVLYRDGHCRYAVDGRDPDSDKRDWHLDGYDLRTSSGLGCEQRKDPTGGGRYAVAVGPDNRELLLDASSGAVVYKAGNGESIADTDGQFALVRTADVKSVRAVELATGSTAWTRPAGKSVKVGLGPGVVVFTDPGANQLVAVDEHDGHSLLDAKSGATVLGYTSNGLVVNIGRTVGLLTYRSAP
jgi:outer membrane protein assembly factor BamB